MDVNATNMVAFNPGFTAHQSYQGTLVHVLGFTQVDKESLLGAGQVPVKSITLFLPALLVASFFLVRIQISGTLVILQEGI